MYTSSRVANSNFILALSEIPPPEAFLWFNVDFLLKCGSPAGAAVAASAGLNGFIGS